MAKRANTTAVGAFIVSALAIIIATVMVFGAGRFFRSRYEFVCFFTGSLNGLKVGAPVKFRGVQIGTVTEIRLRLPGQPAITDVEAKTAALPVFIELDQSQIAGLGGAADVTSEKVAKAFLARGLRAQLVTESLLTGLLYVDLDFHEQTPPRFALPADSKYREIPTVPTTFEQMQQTAFKALAKLDQIDFGGLIASLTDAAKASSALAGSPDLKRALVQVRETAASMQVAVAGMSRAVEQLNAHIDPVMNSLKETFEQASATLASAQATLREFNGALEPDSPLGYRAIHALENLSEASRAVAALADYLQRNPSALVRGKAHAEAGTR